jgi:hypothetical protein
MIRTAVPEDALPISPATLYWSQNYTDAIAGVDHPRILRFFRVPFKVINGCVRPEPMLVRYRLLDTPLGSVNLHHFLRGDEDRDLHDHPFSFATLILRGGYVEQTPAAADAPYGAYRYTTRRPGELLLRPARWAHRVDLRGQDAWTLIAMTKKKREWGFFTIAGWTPFRAYHSIAGCADESPQSMRES